MLMRAIIWPFLLSIAYFNLALFVWPVIGIVNYPAAPQTCQSLNVSKKWITSILILTLSDFRGDSFISLLFKGTRNDWHIDLAVSWTAKQTPGREAFACEWLRAGSCKICPHCKYGSRWLSMCSIARSVIVCPDLCPRKHRFDMINRWHRFLAGPQSKHWPVAICSHLPVSVHPYRRHYFIPVLDSSAFISTASNLNASCSAVDTSVRDFFQLRCLCLAGLPFDPRAPNRPCKLCIAKTAFRARPPMSRIRIAAVECWMYMKRL